MSDSIEKLRILCETTFGDFPDASIQAWIDSAIRDYERLNKKTQAQQQRIAELERINSEWAKVTQPAFDYVDACEIAKLGKSKIGALVESHKGLAAHVEQIRRAYLNAGVDIQMLFEIQPRQPDNSYLVDGQDCTELNRVIHQSSTTSLNAVRREAAKDAYYYALHDIRADSSNINKLKAETYAAKKYPDKE